MPELTRVDYLSSSLKPLSMVDFHRVRDLALEACGITLREEKRILVSSRLDKLVRRHGFHSYTDYLSFLSVRKHRAEFFEFIDTLTTNHSGFWREPEHFEFLQKSVFPQNSQRLRVWSAACATGEEPYTVAMCALTFGVENCSIAASDISRTALSIARRGIYAGNRISALPASWANRFFDRRDLSEADPGPRQISQRVRALVHYAPLNLLHAFTHVGEFDVVFCRNAMIYFAQPTRDELVIRLARQLREGGYLFTGHSETLLKVPRGLQYVQPAVYRKIG